MIHRNSNGTYIPISCQNVHAFPESISATDKISKSFDDSDFREASWEEVEELIAEKTAQIEKNSVGLYGSGQISVEGQYLENIFMKGVIRSDTPPPVMTT